ncbi:odorant receptor 22c-like isoform X2 [Harpegnathos saltator]|uniref:odorant receptor 22c-like isoform X2 n=1 Tax=Harpegnathos saltator TaxID=610380 RepID=UPI000DBEE856|nr:odorant receptor 22c-like isoform X2 [Harpegnathos saltator]
MDVTMKYYNINRLLLLSIGLWPYQKSTSNKIYVVFMLIIFTQTFALQMASFLTMGFSIRLLLEVLSTVFITIVFLFKYNTIYLKMDNIKLFLERIEYDWSTLKDSTEIEIMKKQTNIGRLYTKYFTLTMYIITFLFVMTHYVPFMLDIVIPLAEPRPRKILIAIEMFIDRHKYFHLILLYIILISSFGITTIIAAETLLMALVQHTCGLLKVSSYRITCAFDNDYHSVLAHGKNCVVCTRLASAVKIHRSAIMFTDHIKDCFAISYLILISFGVASLSINLYRLSMVVAVVSDIDILIISAFICGHFFYMFWCNYAGQELINHSAEVYYQTYNAQWYMSAVHSQKMLILILRRSAKPLSFSVSNIFVGSLEGFGTVINTHKEFYR